MHVQRVCDNLVASCELIAHHVLEVNLVICVISLLLFSSLSNFLMIKILIRGNVCNKVPRLAK